METSLKLSVKMVDTSNVAQLKKYLKAESIASMHTLTAYWSVHTMGY